jgi:hypothetical protein
MKMKLLSVLILMLFASCGSNFSPEGRLNDKIEEMQSQIDSLKIQNEIILDSLTKTNAAIRNQSKNW